MVFCITLFQEKSKSFSNINKELYEENQNLFEKKLFTAQNIEEIPTNEILHIAGTVASNLVKRGKIT